MSLQESSYDNIPVKSGLYPWIRFCALAVAGLACSTLTGWIAGIPSLAALLNNRIPMAPSTAVLFLLSGAAIFLQTHAPERRIKTAAFYFITAIIMVIASVLLILSVHKFHLEAEHLFFTISHNPNEPPIGHMSPLTAFCFLLTAASFLAVRKASSFKSQWEESALWPSCLLLLVSIALVLAYFYGMPIMYESGFIPPAITTSIAFLLLGIASFMLVGTRLGVFDPEPKEIERHGYMLAWVFLILASAVVMIGFLNFRQVITDHRAEVEMRLSAVVDLKVEDLVQWRNERLGDGRVFYENIDFSRLVKRIIEDPLDADARGLLIGWMGRVQTAYNYNRICLHDASGTELISIPDTSEPHASGWKRYAEEALHSEHMVFTDFNRNEYDNQVYLKVLVPVRDEADGSPPLGLLAMRIDPRTYLYPSISRWPASSQTAETLLVRQDNKHVLYLNELKFNKEAALNFRLPLTQSDLPATQAILGAEGIIRGRDYRGIPVLACARAVPDSPWFLIARMDLAEVYAPIRQRLWMLIGFICFSLIAAGAVMASLWRRQKSIYYKERLETAEVLQEQEVRYRRTLDGMQEGCQILGMDWRYLYVNDSAVRQGRKRREELMGHTMMEVYDGIEDTPLFQVLRQCMKERVSKQFENEFIYPDGYRGYFELSIEPVPEGLFVLSVDITEKKRAEEQLTHLTNVLRALRNVNQLIIHEKDRDLLVRRTCEILAETRGYRSAWVCLKDDSGGICAAAEAGIGKEFSVVRSDLAQGRYPECCRLAMERNEIVVMRHTAVNCTQCPVSRTHRDTAVLAAALRHEQTIYGVLVVALPSVVADNEEEQSLFMELCGDVAFALHGIETTRERERAEHALRESELKYRTLFEASVDGILIADVETRKFKYANPAICRWLGYSPEELAGMDAASLVPESDLERVRTDFEAQVRGEKTLAEDVPCLTKDGVIVYSDVTTVSMMVEGKAYNAGFFRDITERKRVQEEHEKLRMQLTQAQKMEAVGQLAGGVAHDFNNILQAMMGYTQMLLDSAEENGEAGEELAEIYKGVERAATLTRQLLAFSRRQVMQPRTLDLNAVVENLLKMLRRVIGEHIEMKWMPGSHLGAVHADVGMLEQVLMNLCINARDAMPSGGTLNIETQNVRIDSDYCENHIWAKPGRYVLLSITDTGCGIAGDVLEHIFEPFFTTKPADKGTGLGLATVYGIVKQHEGMISAYSEVGTGTTFKIYLPICEQRAETIGRMLEGAVVGGHETILLAEDDEAVRELGVRVLEHAGYCVHAARNGEEAVELFEKHNDTIDLLLLDVVMPRIGGHEVYSRIQSIRQGVAVLFTSGYSANAVHTNFVLKEGLRLITKPYSPITLLRAVRTVLDQTKDKSNS